MSPGHGTKSAHTLGSWGKEEEKEEEKEETVASVPSVKANGLLIELPGIEEEELTWKSGRRG